MPLLRLIHGNLMQCQKKILNILLNQTVSLHQRLDKHHLLPDINFNEHCLIKNNILITKKVINLYIS